MATLDATVGEAVHVALEAEGSIFEPSRKHVSCVVCVEQDHCVRYNLLASTIVIELLNNEGCAAIELVSCTMNSGGMRSTTMPPMGSNYA